MGASLDDIFRGFEFEPIKLHINRTADSIAAFCRLRKKSLGYSDLAIEEWEADLKWLHQTYYVGRYNFSWPQV